MVYNLTLLGNVTDIATTAVVVSNTFDNLVPFILVFEFLIIFMLGINAQMKRIAQTNALMWGTIAGLVTSVTAILWTGVSATVNGNSLGIVNTSTIMISLAVTILFAILYFLQDLD